MQSFLQEVADEVYKKHEALEDIIFVLPSKRAGSFLKNYLARSVKKTLFSPKIYGIEAFVEEISGLTYATNTQLLFELYNTYLKNSQGEKDSFFDFSKWGQVLLQDFNEVDRYLVAPDKIFKYLSAIQEVNHWYLKPNKTKLMQDYIQFWSNLEQLYNSFIDTLLGKGIGHQGLVYKKACANLHSYLKSTQGMKHIFIGFNALNAAETHIIQEILSTSDADIYWDTDPYFIEDPIHDAGYFIRQHRRNWAYLQDKPLKGLKENYLSKKNIRIVGVPKNVSQVKYAGHLLTQLHKEEPKSLKNTAVVLGDEALLNPLINSVPEHIEKVNITMGYPLNKTPVAGMFTQFFELYLHRDPQGWFYKNVISFLSHNYIQLLLHETTSSDSSSIQEEIKKRNWVYIDRNKIIALEQTCQASLSLLFFDVNPSPHEFLMRCQKLIAALKKRFQEDKNTLALEYLYHFYLLFNQLMDLIKKHPFVDDIKSLHSLYKELLSVETVDFQGEPLDGLQIMGMLESRNLDFETIIITSVNEGILPSGKSNNSFIPFDVKRDFGLPTHKEKDAVYTYHFYRLLQRAKNVYLLYNTEPDVLQGGEKSRLIDQLLTDSNKLKDIVHIVAAPDIIPAVKTPQNITKNTDLLSSLRSSTGRGLSPTSLTNYIRNPIDFYKKTILKIEDLPEVEETVANNTLGTIVHNILEELYMPFVGSYLSADKLTVAKSKIETTARNHFGKSYSDGNISRGKNLIAFNVVVRYVQNFINREIEEAGKHQIKIIALEKYLEVDLDIPEIDFPAVLKGKLDRIDERDGMLHIIDYKTGNVKQSQVEVVDWNEIIVSYEHSKAFQLLCYAFMYNSEQPFAEIKAGIVSFKNLKPGLLPFGTKEKKTSRIKNTIIDQNTLQLFREQLHKLIVEICNPEIPIVEKVV